MVGLAYIGYAILIFLSAAAIGSAMAAMNGRANPNFAAPGFGLVMFVNFGIPCYFIGSYLRAHGSESTSFIILAIAGILGILLGLQNRA
jgi:hypothetical protein